MVDQRRTLTQVEVTQRIFTSPYDGANAVDQLPGTPIFV